MIDRPARNSLAEAIRALASGQLSNDQFEDRVSFIYQSPDPAVHEVFSQGAWSLYSDLWEYRLTGKHRLPKRAKSEVARWVLFLKTDQPYRWPTMSPLAGITHLLLSILTVGIYASFHRRKVALAGDISVWPFIDKTTYELSLRKPVYLHAAL